MTDRIPAEVFHPGELVREEMEARGWDVDDLAYKSGVHAKSIRAIIACEERMVGETLYRIADALGIHSRIFRGKQDQWDQYPDRRSYPPDDDVRTVAKRSGDDRGERTVPNAQ